VNTDELYARLTPIFRDIFDDDDLTPTPTLSADQVDGWDSLAHINLVVAIEQDFGVRFAATEIEGLSNVGEFVGVLASKLGP